MNTQAVLNELTALHPGKPIKLLPENDPSEIICEFNPPDNHPDWSLAVAVIDRSIPHFHRKTTEVYQVIKGTLHLHVDAEEFDIYEGEQFTITPGRVHWAIGNETWVEVYCTPGYSPEDHVLASQEAVMTTNYDTILSITT